MAQFIGSVCRQLIREKKGEGEKRGHPLIRRRRLFVSVPYFLLAAIQKKRAIQSYDQIAR